MFNHCIRWTFNANLYRYTVLKFINRMRTLLHDIHIHKISLYIHNAYTPARTRTHIHMDIYNCNYQLTGHIDLDQHWPRYLLGTWQYQAITRTSWFIVCTVQWHHLRTIAWITKTEVDGNPDSKVHGANMGPIWGRQDPGRPHVGHMNFAIREPIRFHWNIIVLVTQSYMVLI